MLKNLRNKLNEKKNKKGFTLIELIIVIAIIAILAALLLPKLGSVKENSNKTSDIANAKKIAEATLSLYAEDKLTSLPAGTTAEGNATLKAYLQNATLKTKAKSVTAAKGSDFGVQLSSDGVVTVTAGTGAGAKVLYPVADSEYDAK